MSIRRGRLRSTIKWGGAVVTVLLLIVWVGSRWYGVSVLAPPTAMISVLPGQLRVCWLEEWSAKPDVWEFRIYSDSNTPWGKLPFNWWFQTYRATWLLNIWERGIGIPIWFLAMLTTVPTFLIWRHDRKHQPGACPNCGYSRTGLPADRACPECGTLPESDRAE